MLYVCCMCVGELCVHEGVSTSIHRQIVAFALG